MTPSGFHAKPVKRFARNHSVKIQAAANRRTNGNLSPRPYRHASPAAIAIWAWRRSEEHTSELQSLMRISYAVFCLKKKKNTKRKHKSIQTSIPIENHKYIKRLIEISTQTP